jgi:hypothetical protein
MIESYDPPRGSASLDCRWCVAEGDVAGSIASPTRLAPALRFAGASCSCGMGTRVAVDEEDAGKLLLGPGVCAASMGVAAALTRATQTSRRTRSRASLRRA